MYCPDKLKLNKFVEVRIPRPAEYFSRLGAHQMAGSAYSGDEVAAAAARQTKVDMIAAQNEDYLRWAESNPESSPED